MSTIKANTLLHSDGSTTTQPSIPALDQRMAKAWVDFNGQGTVAVRSSYGVSSVTDVAVGHYQVNFSTPFATSTSYIVTGSASRVAATSEFFNPYSSGRNTNWFRVEYFSHGVATDTLGINLAIFGN